MHDPGAEQRAAADDRQAFEVEIAEVFDAHAALAQEIGLQGGHQRLPAASSVAPRVEDGDRLRQLQGRDPGQGAEPGENSRLQGRCRCVSKKIGRDDEKRLARRGETNAGAGVKAAEAAPQLAGAGGAEHRE